MKNIYQCLILIAGLSGLVSCDSDTAMAQGEETTDLFARKSHPLPANQANPYN